MEQWCLISNSVTMASTLTQGEARLCGEYLEWVRSTPGLTKQQLLVSIPLSAAESYAPLATLSALLDYFPDSWPVLDLQQTYNKLWKLLPEEAKSGHASSEAQQLLDHVAAQCKSSYSSLLDLLRPSTTPAIVDPQSGRSISHERLGATLQAFSLPLSIETRKSKPVIAISLPNGPLLAMTILAAATYYTAAPIAHGNGIGAQQFRSDVLQSGARVVVASAADVDKLGLRDNWLAEAGISVFLADLDDEMAPMLRYLDGSDAQRGTSHRPPLPNRADDTGILLFTSGTSGTKKLVPLSVHSLVCGVVMVIESWGLNPSMRCLNQMPLNHVGGLVRNLFAPILSGGSVICCSAFDANLFWDCVEDFSPTWYYASPSMHQCILEAAADRPEALAKSEIQLVCNAAGGLLPSLANRLCETFSNHQHECTVLPSYGMTECMPISTPPLNYRLEKSGTSGVTVGPEIAILDANNTVLPANTTGRIAVRGAPVFAGYLRAGDTMDTTCFTPNGWFDTGDVGLLDDEGYLYINGRSKEVINRGGELISPFEIEEAVMSAANDAKSPIFDKVAKTLAFSVRHDALQEVVGIVITKQAGSKRPSLGQIQTALKPLIGQVKIPSLVVYMDGGLPTNNNKVLRIRLADRLELPEISDLATSSERHYEAACPPPNTPISQSISCGRVPQPDYDEIRAEIQAFLPPDVGFHIQADGSPLEYELLLAPSHSNARNDDLSTGAVMQRLSDMLEGYHMPGFIRRLTEPFPRTSSGVIDEGAVQRMLREAAETPSNPPIRSSQSTIIQLFSEILAVPTNQLSASSDFFDAGGDSMRAGRLLSSLRKTFQLRLPIDLLFANSTVSALAAIVDEKLGNAPAESPRDPARAEEVQPLIPGCEQMYSSTKPFLLALQLTPLIIFWPMRRALAWTVFMYCLAYTQQFSTNSSIPGRLFNLVLSMGVGRLVTRTVTPFLAMVFKWLVIGRYREGLYPMWGPYHTRWWLCEKIIATAGMGVLSYFNWSRVQYLRLMGAKVGKNVTINRGAMLGEYDLITIEDDVVLERCKVRPMAPERNTSMYLGRIVVGKNASVGLASIVAPGTVVPANACIGPNSSSWEIKDADETNRDLASGKIPGAHWALTLFLGLPLQLLTSFIRALPWLACLVALVRNEPNTSTVDQVREVIIWFASPDRVGWHYAALATNSLLGPVFLFGAVLAIKRTFDKAFGKTRPGPAATRSAMTSFRMQLTRTLLPAPRLHKLTELFGTHYEATSVIMRALGAKVGKHVYWPGTGPSMQDYDLIEVGDNVVFGSRAHIVTSDGTGSDLVRVKDGAMVADRVVLLPGSLLGEKTVMGSGALAKRETHYPAGTTWVGSKKNDAVCLSRPVIEEKPVDSGNAYLAPPPLRSALSSSNSSRTTLTRQVSFDTTSDPKKHRPALGSRHTSSDRLVPAIDEKPAASTDLSPFGRAFYHHIAPYRVWSQAEVTLYSTTITILTAIWWNIGSISAVQIVARLYLTHALPHTPTPLSHTTASRPFTLYLLFLALIIAIMAAQSLLTLLFLIAAKWALLGRRRPGSYDWDASPYCQRWQLYLKLESLRRNCYGGNGILAMLTGTHWLVLYFRALGASIGKDCALFAGGQPSLLFTEPDLLTLGDRVAVDDSSLVGHINTAGRFALNELSVGDRSVLRSGSRLLSGGSCAEDACLLEHTLVMAGDVVEKGCTVQGWPAGEFTGSRTPTLGVRRVWGVED